ncbi:hypothetical protein [Chromobacterium vaccinii]|uniref:hypothetical protein n=1 Tax=Chromobacterium vaccinii TaxID=1108595 RepID=UPI000A67C3CC|nr:hypothetical protein [Chromobacterium vaccinii]
MNARNPLPRAGRDATGLSGGSQTALGQWFDQLKDSIDLHDLAARLGLQRQGKGNYHSPHHPDSSASLSIFADGRG